MNKVDEYLEKSEELRKKRLAIGGIIAVLDSLRLDGQSPAAREALFRSREQYITWLNLYHDLRDEVEPFLSVAGASPGALAGEYAGPAEENAQTVTSFDYTVPDAAWDWLKR